MSAYSSVRKNFCCIGLLTLAGWSLLLHASADGRNLDEASQLYSQGVQSYFAGQASNAESLLSRALAINDQDPRFFYFRALSRLRLGRAAEARNDMELGAALEAARSNRFAVGTALQRVQGEQRLLLERYRREAREEATTVGAQVAQQHQRQMTARDAGAIRERVVIPLDEILRAEGPRPLSAEDIAQRAAARRRAATAPNVSSRDAAPSRPAPTTEDPFRDDSLESAREPAPSTSESSPTPEAAPSGDDAEANPFDF